MQLYVIRCKYVCDWTCVFVCKCIQIHTHTHTHIYMICQPLPVTPYCLIYLSQSHWDRMPHWDDCWILPLRTPQKGTPQTHATHGRIRRRNRLKKRRKNLLSRFLEWTTTYPRNFSCIAELPWLSKPDSEILPVSKCQTQRIHHGTPSGMQINVYGDAVLYW